MTNVRNRSRSLAALGLLGLCALTSGLSACFDSDLTEVPKNIIVADNLYTNLSGFEAGLNALYFQVRRERFGQDNSNNGLVQTAMTAGTDNVYGMYVSPPERIFNQWVNFNVPANDFITHIWNLMYQTINAANTIVDRAENPSVSWTPEEKARVVGEARLIRAWAYRHLTYLYGDVPLNLHESTGSNIRTDWERTPRDSVRRAIINDLRFAEANLPATSANSGKVVKAVAQHYLAEMYLALNKPDSAEIWAQAVVSSGLYKLITARYGVRANQPGVPFMDQFYDGNVNRVQGNTEVLWALQYAQNVLGGGASIMRRTYLTRYEGNAGMKITAENGGRGIGRLATTRYAINLYEANDQRGGMYAIRRFYIVNNPATIGTSGRKVGDTLKTVATAVEPTSETNTNGSQTRLWPSTRKWDWAEGPDSTVAEQYEDQPYIRYAETLLLLAEAQMKNG
ncbi:MAG TPA: RagB/SusD family nutrient uptake outer membrane protein, partial [Gemmatimonadaceae bacterium]|nr:RagB/SusD family nutrient uptake outer membrane protein [Gemmatimonadaceae bacterium]